MAYLDKVYKYVSEENFEAFLKVVGIPEEQVEKFKNFKPSSQLVKDGDNYKYISVTDEGTKETPFVPGAQYEEIVHGGLPIKTTYTIDGNTVTQHIESSKGTATFKREYNGDDLKVTITSSAWDGVAYRYYKA